ncbi:MAG: hypothetical protein OHK0039_15770 [Bacteroidia bacterium]
MGIFWKLLICCLPLGLVACRPEPRLEVDLSAYVLADSFRLEVVAAAPLVQDPVALAFDADGRMWVVEMRGYMPDMDGTGEDLPTGRIVILEDRDHDGFAGHRTVFLDGLVLPRALAIVKGGILYAEPPNLWFVENIGDRPGRRILVDSAYAVGGNVEHQPNGLLRGLDNWYYSAKADMRYRYRAGRWEREQTEFRGQWGLSQDDAGRLFYNDNSNQLLGDEAPPGWLLRNPHHEARTGTGLQLAPNSPLFPIRTNTGINRGYQPHMLDSNRHLTQFTAAAGLIVYRGDQFPARYYGDAFVPEPAANLVKRNRLTEDDGRLRGHMAYDDREFLAATDECFRPVNLCNAPDGTIYLIDFHRGIIQHKTYLTSYLRGEIASRGLDTVLRQGRILRIVHPSPVRRAVPRLSRADEAELVALLAHPNAWHRETAQRLLVEQQAGAAIPHLRRLLQRHDLPLGQVHALWTLEGLGALRTDDLLPLLHGGQQPVRIQALRCVPVLAAGADSARLLDALEELADDPSRAVQYQRTLSLGAFRGQMRAWQQLLAMAQVWGGDEAFRDALLSGLAGREADFAVALRAGEADLSALQVSLASAQARGQAVPRGQPAQPVLTESQRAVIAQGKELYIRHCSTCHQEDGRGRSRVAPPLQGSEWVTGPPQRLAMILLHGLAGPITVAGTRYAPPDMPGTMPGLKDSRELDDADLAAIMSYVRHAWGHRAGMVEAEAVGAVRRQSAARQEMLSEPVLRAMFP